MSKWYGSINNRIEEGHNYNEDKLIHEGDDITTYYWGDRHCYYVTKVIDQKHIMVHIYEVCADHSKKGGVGHQDWLYFKTLAEMNKYLNSCHLMGLDGKEYNYDESVEEGEDEEWTFRYNHWNRTDHYTPEVIEKMRKDIKTHTRNSEDEEHITNMIKYYTDLTDKELDKIKEGKEVIKYRKITEGISFGVRDYYYDWSFWTKLGLTH